MSYVDAAIAILNGLQKVVEMAYEAIEGLKEKVTVRSSLELNVPGTGPVDRILHGRFPRIAGTYWVQYEHRRQRIEVDYVTVDGSVRWRVNFGDSEHWWNLSESTIEQIYWIELVEVDRPVPKGQTNG